MQPEPHRVVASRTTTLAPYLYGAGIAPSTHRRRSGRNARFLRVLRIRLARTRIDRSRRNGFLDRRPGRASSRQLIAWNAYARFFARHCAVSLETALTADAFSWLALLIMWVGFLRPFGASATGRGIADCAGDVRVRQAIRRRAIQQRGSRRRDHVRRQPRRNHRDRGARRDGRRTTSGYARRRIVDSDPRGMGTLGRRTLHRHRVGRLLRHRYGVLSAVSALDLTAREAHGQSSRCGTVVSNAALFVGLIFFYKLVEHQYNRHVAHRSVFYISIFPTAIFFSAVYTESLFLALTVASFYFIREHKWLARRNHRILRGADSSRRGAVVVPMAIEWLSSPGARQAWQYPLERLMRPLLGMALIPLGLLSYMSYLWILTGDPLYFSHVQINWHRHLAPPWVSMRNSIYLLMHGAKRKHGGKSVPRADLHVPHDRDSDRCVPPALGDVLELLWRSRSSSRCRPRA